MKIMRSCPSSQVLLLKEVYWPEAKLYPLFEGEEKKRKESRFKCLMCCQFPLHKIHFALVFFRDVFTQFFCFTAHI